MGSHSAVQLAIKGIDKTGAAFDSIKAKARVTGFQIKSMMGGALAAAGAYMGFDKIISGVNQLGHLSDIAQKTATSVDELTRATTALNVLGVQNMGLEEIGKAFGYMQKSTGLNGMDGFYKNIEDIAKIGDVSERAKKFVEVFGRSGMELMPLINACGDGTKALRGVMDAMPGIKDSAANAGDGAADALGFAENEVRKIWLEGIGFIANKLNNDFTGDVRTASLNAGNWLTFHIKKAVIVCIGWFDKLRSSLKPFGEGIGSAFGTFKESAKWYDWLKLINPGSIAADFIIKKFTGKESAITKAWDAAKEGYESGMKEAVDDFEEIDKRMKARLERATGEYEFRKNSIKHFKENYDKLSVGMGKGGNGKGLNDRQNEKIESRQKINNTLFLAGSNDVLKLQKLGPDLRSEQKKTNQILEKISGKLDGINKNAAGESVSLYTVD